jgi:hypothetical protein
MRFLNRNKDVFAWSAKDLQGVDKDIIEHALQTDEKIPPKKQKLRKMSEVSGTALGVPLNNWEIPT